jgi:hypothetical protein
LHALTVAMRRVRVAKIVEKRILLIELRRWKSDLHLMV